MLTMGNSQTRTMGNVAVGHVTSTSVVSPESAPYPHHPPRSQSQVPTVRFELNHTRNMQSAPIHVEFPSQSSSTHTNGAKHLSSCITPIDPHPHLNRSLSTPTGGTTNELDNAAMFKKPGLQPYGSEPRQKLIGAPHHHHIPSKAKKKRPS